MDGTNVPPPPDDCGRATEFFDRTYTLEDETTLELRAEVAALKERIKELETPDMYWDVDNMEDTVQGDLDDYADDTFQTRGVEVGTEETVEFQCARRLPNVVVRYRFVDGEDDGRGPGWKIVEDSHKPEIKP